jgi:hypothetical protein
LLLKLERDPRKLGFKNGDYVAVGKHPVVARIFGFIIKEDNSVTHPLIPAGFGPAVGNADGDGDECWIIRVKKEEAEKNFLVNNQESPKLSLEVAAKGILMVATSAFGLEEGDANAFAKDPEIKEGVMRCEYDNLKIMGCDSHIIF